MSLYRQASGASRGAITAIALLCLLLGVAGGFALGRSTASDPDLAELAAKARAEVRPARSALELVTIEYPQAVRGGEVVAETEYQAATSQAASATSAVAAAAPELRELDPEGVEEATAATERVEELVADIADSKEVADAAAEATRAVEALADPAAP